MGGNELQALKFSALKIPPESFHQFSDSGRNKDGLKVFSPTFKTGKQQQCVRSPTQDQQTARMSPPTQDKKTARMSPPTQDQKTARMSSPTQDQKAAGMSPPPPPSLQDAAIRVLSGSG